MSLSDSSVFSPMTYENQAPPLDGREVEVIRLVVEGLKDEEIGPRLGISPPEAERLVSSVYDKLGASDRLELIILAFYHGIVPLPY
jgi:DNA-binding NarL/FixJ family response regulator